MAHKPLVTIAIPSYNHAPYLGKTITSALEQTYRPIEILVTDDGSRDGSLEIAQSFAAKYPDEVQVFTHEGHCNRGISETVNAGFARARGKYFTGVPSDDVLYPHKIEDQVAFLEAHPEVGMVYGRAELIGPDDQVLGPTLGEDITGDPDPLERLIQGNPIPAITNLIRRSCMEQVGPHTHGLVFSDWEYWIRLLAHFPLGFLPQTVMKYRVHDYNTSVGIGRAKWLAHTLAMILTLRDKATEYGGALTEPRYRASIELQLAYLQFAGGNLGEGECALQSAFRVDPSLSEDGAKLLRWVKACDWDYRRENAAAGGEFVQWAVSSLRGLVTERTTQQISPEADVIPLTNAARRALYVDDQAGARQMVARCLLTRPATALDADFRFTAAQSMMSPRVLERVRRVKRLFTNQRSSTSPSS